MVLLRAYRALLTVYGALLTIKGSFAQERREAFEDAAVLMGWLRLVGSLK